jgi:hypothetical protein
MRKIVLTIVLAIVVGCSAAFAASGPLKVYVAEFAVTGAQNREELRTTLQTLLATRLSGERIVAVATPAEADAVVSGMYVVFGKVYSVDATVKDRTGKVLTRGFEQGDDPGQLIPSLGRLAQGLAASLEKVQMATAAPAAAAPPSVPQAVASPLAPVTPVPEPRPSPPSPPVASDIVRPESLAKGGVTTQASKRLEGALLAVAPGRTLEGGEREIFVAGSHDIRVFVQGKELRQVAGASLPGSEYVLGLDTADLDGDGMPELYVTAYDGDRLVSQVWQYKGGALSKIAGDLPYYFRAIALAGEGRKIYAQKMGTDEDFVGEVAELYRSGNEYETRNPLKLPRFGNIYDFNEVSDGAGKRMFVVISPDNNLLVYSPQGEELWRSSDKYGGSETYVKRRDKNLTNARLGEDFRTTFLEQRLTVTAQGDIIVPQSSGGWSIGNSRSFKKNALYCLAWNGSSLEEKWHTRESQNYLADYFYDEPRKELVLLEVVSKEGVLSKGASTITVKKVE